MKKVIFYYDGFNFYRGLKDAKWKDCYWLDLYKFSKNLISKYDNYEIINVNYFTAKPNDYNKRLRQNIFLDTNKKLYADVLDLHYGKYKPEIVYCTNEKCKKKIEVPKEKQTDVNIAVNIMHDAYKNNCDVTILVSGDNDLLPALKCIKKFKPEQKILVFYPPKRNKSNLHDYATYPAIHLLNCKETFIKSRLERKVDFSDGTFAIIPPEWDF